MSDNQYLILYMYGGDCAVTIPLWLFVDFIILEGRETCDWPVTWLAHGCQCNQAFHRILCVCVCFLSSVTSSGKPVTTCDGKYAPWGVERDDNLCDLGKMMEERLPLSTTFWPMCVVWLTSLPWPALFSDGRLLFSDNFPSTPFKHLPMCGGMCVACAVWGWCGQGEASPMV